MSSATVHAGRLCTAGSRAAASVAPPAEGEAEQGGASQHHQGDGDRRFSPNGVGSQRQNEVDRSLRAETINVCAGRSILLKLLVGLTAQHDELRAGRAERGPAVATEVGDRLEVRHQSAGQPHQFDVALGLPFEPPARLDAIEIAVQGRSSEASQDDRQADRSAPAQH